MTHGIGMRDTLNRRDDVPVEGPHLAGVRRAEGMCAAWSSRTGIPTIVFAAGHDPDRFGAVPGH